MAKTKRKDSGLSFKNIIIILLVVSMVALVHKIVITLNPETITTITYIVVILFAALMISLITLLPFIVLNNGRTEQRKKRMEQKPINQQPTFIVLNGPPMQPRQQPETKPDRLLQKPDDIKWKVVSNDVLDLKVFGSEDKDW